PGSHWQRPFGEIELDPDELTSAAALGIGEPFDALLARAVAASTKDIGTYEAALGGPSKIALTLRITGPQESIDVQLEKLAASIETYDDIVLVAPPGTGKSTTLVQVAGAVAALGTTVAAFIPLNEWSARRASFLDAITARQAFSGFQKSHLRLLAIHGK